MLGHIRIAILDNPIISGISLNGLIVIRVAHEVEHHEPFLQNITDAKSNSNGCENAVTEHPGVSTAYPALPVVT